MKKYAFVEYGGTVLSIETRCSGFRKQEVQPGELAIEDIIHPDLIYRYVEIPEGITVTEGMLYSNGEFKENPAAPDSRISALEERADGTEAAILGIMDAVVAMQA